MALKSYWRKEAQRVIACVLVQNPGMVDFDILEAIDKSYPFGPRRHLPYKMWLEERRKTMTRISTNPILRVCGACGAGVGKDCRMLGTADDDLMAASRLVLRDAIEDRKPPDVLANLRQMSVHSSRLAHLTDVAQRSVGELPLFRDIKVAT